MEGYEGAAVDAGILFFLVYLGIIIVLIAGLWKVFTKAGQPGWAAIIPIYNIYIMTKIAGKEWWWMLLFFIPCVNIVISLLLALAIAENFGKSAGFGIGLWLLPMIFYPILGWGSATYQPKIAPVV